MQEVMMLNKIKPNLITGMKQQCFSAFWFYLGNTQKGGAGKWSGDQQQT